MMQVSSVISAQFGRLASDEEVAYIREQVARHRGTEEASALHSGFCSVLDGGDYAFEDKMRMMAEGEADTNNRHQLKRVYGLQGKDTFAYVLTRYNSEEAAKAGVDSVNKPDSFNTLLFRYLRMLKIPPHVSFQTGPKEEITVAFMPALRNPAEHGSGAVE